MVSVYQPEHHHPLNYAHLPSLTSADPIYHQSHLALVAMANSLQAAGATAKQPPTGNATLNPTVGQALEIARESADGAQDSTVRDILDTAMAQIWQKVLDQPDTYIMTRDEFAVFNYFQRWFADNKVATAARKRYWDNSRA